MQMSRDGWIERHGRAVSGVCLAAACVILLFHYHTGLQHFGMHDLLRRLFYLPVIVAAIAAGLGGGLLAAGVVVVGYLPHLRQLALACDRALDHGLELLLLPVVGALVGGFADSSRRARARAAERGRLAALGEVGVAMMAQLEGPLASIEGQAETLAFLASRARNTAMGFAAEVVRDEALRARTLLADLRGLGAVEGRRVGKVNLSALLVNVVREIQASRAAEPGLELGSIAAHVKVQADGRAIAFSIRALLFALLDAIPPRARLEASLSADGEGRSTIAVAASHPAGALPDLERELGTVFGARASEYRFEQALCLHLLVGEGASVAVRCRSEGQAVVEIHFGARASGGRIRREPRQPRPERRKPSIAREVP